jgi:hypothetical protein
MKLIIIKFSPTSCPFIPVRSRYSPQHPILKELHSLFFPQYLRQTFTPIRNNVQNVYILIFTSSFESTVNNLLRGKYCNFSFPKNLLQL